MSLRTAFASEIPAPSPSEPATGRVPARILRLARRPGKPDLARAQAAVRELLLALGEDPERDGLRDTPKRVAKSLAEQVAGLTQDPSRHLGRVFAADYDGLVIVRDISFNSLCEHHLLSFMGHAHIAYLPRDNRVVGLSKFARLVEGFARRPQVQERLTGQIADALEQHLNPRGLIVRLEATHLCMQVRGVLRSGASTVTVIRRGELAGATRAYPEADALAGGHTGSGHPLG